MKRIILTFGLVLTGLALFGQSPRIRLNQITKDSLTGSVVLSGSDSNMVYSRDFFLNLTDSVLILFGDTLSTTATAFTGVVTDLTLTGNGTVGNELKVDTAVIATLTALADSLAGIISSVTTDLTLTGDGSVATPLKVDTSVIATIKALADSVATRGTVSSVAVSAGTGISVSGSPITTSGTITVTNTAPDQTVALTGAGINAITGTYPSFTITGTEVDGSTTNELQTISTSGAAGNITLSDGGGTLNLNVNDADASATNEGSLSVGAGGANSSDIVSNTSGSTNVTIAGGSNVTVTESGSTITIASTAGGTGTVTDITAGTFLSGGTITTSGTIALDTASAGLKTYISDNKGTVDLASGVTGTLPVANGGTGATTLTSGAFLKGNGTSAVSGSSNLTETADTVFVSKFLNVDANTLYVNSDSNRVAIGQTQTLEGAGLSVRGGLHLIDPDTTNLTDNVIYIYPKEQTTAGANSSALAMFMAGPGSLSTTQGPYFLMRGNNFVEFANQKGLLGFFSGSGIAEGGRNGQLWFNGDNGIDFETSNGDALYITKTRNVGIQTSSPAYTLDVVGDINASGEVRNSGVILTSDVRYKKDINLIQNASYKLMELNPVSYYWNELMIEKLTNSQSKTKEQIKYGLVAQEVELNFPEFVSEGADGFKAIDYQAIISLLLKGWQEQQTIIETQQAEIETLKTQYNDLLQRIINLENK